MDQETTPSVPNIPPTPNVPIQQPSPIISNQVPPAPKSPLKMVLVVVGILIALFVVVTVILAIYTAAVRTGAERSSIVDNKISTETKTNEVDNTPTVETVVVGVSEELLKLRSEIKVIQDERDALSKAWTQFIYDENHGIKMTLEQNKENDLRKEKMDKLLQDIAQKTGDYGIKEKEIHTKSLASLDVGISDSVYNNYCKNVSPQKNLSNYSSDASSQYPLVPIGTTLQLLNDKKIAKNDVGVVLYHLGQAYAQIGAADNAIRFYKCAAENYVEIYSMYRMAQAYKHGTDSLFKGIKMSNKIDIDYKKSYYWLSVLLKVEAIKNTGLLVADSTIGWNVIAMTDDFENTSKITGTDAAKMSSEAQIFVNKIYAGSVSVNNDTSIGVETKTTKNSSTAGIGSNVTNYFSTRTGGIVLSLNGLWGVKKRNTNSTRIISNDENASIDIGEYSFATVGVSSVSDLEKFVQTKELAVEKVNTNFQLRNEKISRETTKDNSVLIKYEREWLLSDGTATKVKSYYAVDTGKNMYRIVIGIGGRAFTDYEDVYNDILNHVSITFISKSIDEMDNSSMY